MPHKSPIISEVNDEVVKEKSNNSALIKYEKTSITYAFRLLVQNVLSTVKNIFRKSDKKQIEDANQEGTNQDEINETKESVYYKEIAPSILLDYVALGTGEIFRNNEDRYHEFLKKYGSAVVLDIRQMITSLTGFDLKELHKIANDPSLISEKEEIRENLEKRLPFLAKYSNKKRVRSGALYRFGRQADAFIEEIRQSFLPLEKQSKSGMEVTTDHHPASLLLQTLNDTEPDITRFGAGRKLVLMKALAEMQNYSENEIDHIEAQDYMRRFFKDRIFKPRDANSKGKPDEYYLISKHDSENDFRTTEAEFVKNEPSDKNKDKYTKVTPIRMRRTTTENMYKEESEILFSIDAREKSLFSCLIKDIRYENYMGQNHSDRNGWKIGFRSRKELNVVVDIIQKEFEEYINEEIRKRLKREQNSQVAENLEKRLRSQKVFISDIKDSLDGNGFNGTSNTSSDKFKVYKFKLRVVTAKGLIHTYEFQAYLPDGNLDTEFRLGVNTKEHHIRRAFDEHVIDRLHPKHIYTEINQEENRKKAIKMVRNELWNGHIS